MNHDLIKHALCGRYTQLSDSSAYVESSLTSMEDGTLIGAYVTETGDGRFLITDDGDVVFRAAAAGAEITPARAKKYRELSDANGVTLRNDGVLAASCGPDELPFVLATFIATAGEISSLSVKHRPRDRTRFEAEVSAGLKEMYGAMYVKRRAKIVGISGQQVPFPFLLALPNKKAAIIQPVPSSDGKLIWHSVHEAGGKFKDVRGANRDVRLVAVLEASEGVDRARKYFSDMADVVVYSKGPLEIAA